MVGDNMLSSNYESGGITKVGRENKGVKFEIIP